MYINSKTSKREIAVVCYIWLLIVIANNEDQGKNVAPKYMLRQKFSYFSVWDIHGCLIRQVQGFVQQK